MSTDMLSVIASDNFRLARSKPIHEPVTGTTYNVIAIPRYAFILGAWLYVSVAATAAPVASSVGWKGNATTAVADGLITTAEVTGTTIGTYKGVTVPGLWFTNGPGAITFTYTINGSGSTVHGTFTVFVQYSVIH